MAKVKALVMDKDLIDEYSSQVIIIEVDDARHYINSLRAVTKRLVRAFEDTDDMSLRKWINTHGPVLDELIQELGGRVT